MHFAMFTDNKNNNFLFYKDLRTTTYSSIERSTQIRKNGKIQPLGTGSWGGLITQNCAPFNYVGDYNEVVFNYKINGVQEHYYFPYSNNQWVEVNAN